MENNGFQGKGADGQWEFIRADIATKSLQMAKYYCVGISIGTPKFKLAYRLENQCYSLAPKGHMLKMDLEDFKKAYYEKLNGIGKDRIINMVMKMERDAAAQGKDLVLLCYEDVRIGRLVSQNCFC